MSKARIINQENKILISGELVFSTVTEVWKNSLPVIANNTELLFDLSAVSKCNSAGVALILEWIRYAKKRNKLIRFHNIPTQMMSIIKVASLKPLLTSMLI